MQKEVKLGLILGVIVLLILGVFWVSRSDEELPPGASKGDGDADEPIVGEAAAFADLKDAAGEPTEQVRDFKPSPDKWTAAEAGPTGDTTYKVRKHDTLYSIAKKHYGHAKHSKLILEANKDRIPGPRNIPVGTDLILPPRSAAREAEKPETLAPGMRKHRVAKGENLSTIAKKYYRDVPAGIKLLVKANKLADRDVISPGQVLIVPTEP